VKYIDGFVVSLFIMTVGLAQTPEPFKLFLIGDAGENDTSGATLLNLKTKLQTNPNSAVIFLGDNCYKKSFFGLARPEIKGYDGSKITRKRLMSQLAILKGYKGSVYFVPGNHDWWNRVSVKRGKKSLLKEELFIEDSLKNFTTLFNHNLETFLPAKGNPGPVYKEFNNGKLRVIFIDTYRVIMEESKNKNKALLSRFYDELKFQLTEASDKHQKIIVAAHHPIYAKGKHSQPITALEKSSKRFAASNLNYIPYRKMASKIDSLLKTFRPSDIYYVSGHEHSLEYFYKDSLHYIVSGSGSKIDRVKYESVENDKECLRWNEEGFFEIVFLDTHEIVLMHHRKDIKSELKEHCVTGCK
jgi:hypothetical protein